ncbi:MAG TPA: Arc family DNA-binding protein [Gammaproteobacteria bacterium]|nr:Arc family DNA-binding protein [Gammaproteobacteria bacterium]
MATKHDPIRMTLRLPKEIREALDTLVKKGHAGSITAEIIDRLQKSLLLEPANVTNEFALIRQQAAQIQKSADKIESTLAKNKITRSQALQALTEKERTLLEAFQALPEEKQRAVLAMISHHD